VNFDPDDVFYSNVEPEFGPLCVRIHFLDPSKLTAHFCHVSRSHWSADVAQYLVTNDCLPPRTDVSALPSHTTVSQVPRVALRLAGRHCNSDPRTDVSVSLVGVVPAINTS
jgi:hypothetical protein